MNKIMVPKKPLLLLILDGWGYSEEGTFNAIHAAHTPNWDFLWSQFPHCLAQASGRAVGLPDGQMGNSEVGHLHIGAGREVPQDLVRIDDSIANGSFFENPIFLDAANFARQHQSTVHVLGLLSPGGVHSHEDQLLASIKMMSGAGVKSICLHAFLDGRDTPPRSAMTSIKKAQELLKSLPGDAKIASLTGRYYAMDRDKRWDRIQKAYDMLTQGKAAFHANTPEEALNDAYARGESDEFIQPTVVGDVSPINSGDVVLFMNFRADRARQLSYALTEPDFSGFKREKFPEIGQFITLTQYADHMRNQAVYKPLLLENTLGEFLSKQGLRQLRIAETEKYAHVTFFLNGGNETPYPLEQRILVPSPMVATYDLQPEMSVFKLTDVLVKEIESGQYDLIVCNYANPDMVGHTGNFDAAVKAVESIDQCLGKVMDALERVGGVALITADHGNVECMHDSSTHQPHTAHTLNQVPVVYTGHDVRIISHYRTPILYDLAPTILYLLGIKPPSEMTGLVFLEFMGGLPKDSPF